MDKVIDLPYVLLRRGNDKFNSYKTGVKEPEVEEIKEEIAVNNIEKICMVYSKLNEDSLVAAFIYKKAMEKEGISVKLTDITEQIPSTSDRYVWLGVDPERYYDKYKSIVRGMNEIFHSKYPKGKGIVKRWLSPRTIDIFPETVLTGIDEQFGNIPLHKVSRSVIDKFQMDGYKGFMIRLERFFNPNVKISTEEAASIYFTLKNIHRALTQGGDPYIVSVEEVEKDPSIVIDYIKSVTEVKEKINTKIASTEIVSEDKQRSIALYFNFNEIDFLLVKRLMILSNRKYINHSYGLTGHYIETNIDGVTVEEVEKQMK